MAEKREWRAEPPQAEVLSEAARNRARLAKLAPQDKRADSDEKARKLRHAKPAKPKRPAGWQWVID